MTEDVLQETITLLSEDRRLAHRVLFKHRHPNETPEFHDEIIQEFHDGERNRCTIAFRGSAKSTLAEEGMTLMACLREFKHALIVGASEPKALERLHAIRRQFEKNDALRRVFGDLRGKPWTDEKIELSTGVTILAMGRGQSIRGTKNEDYRPDFMLIDDIEDAISVSTPEGREKVLGWVLTELMPAGDEPSLRVRMLANDMHPECLANRLKEPGSGFIVKVYPWEHLDSEGKRVATWADRYPLEEIDKKRARFAALGRMGDYEKEYMCRSETPQDKPFKSAQMKVEPQVRTWQPVYAMFDPARTVSKTSATTGYAAWSWVANRLVIWESWAKHLLPDEIIAAVYETGEKYQPVQIGVEEDGLNQFLMQPLRQEGVRRGVVLPIKPLKAPKGKLDFIRGLQPFFAAGEVSFAQELPDLKAQLQGFPTGKIDAPNALAYALKMRAGFPMYEDFTQANVSLPTLHQAPGRDMWLVVSGGPSLITAVLLQYTDGGLRVFADWAREGEPSEMLPEILKEANLVAKARLSVLVAPEHYDRFNTTGIVQAVRRHAGEPRRGTDPAVGRVEMRALLRRQARGMPAVVCAARSTWVVNGFSGGYCKPVSARGEIGDEAEPGIYRSMMESIESFMGLLKLGGVDNDRDELNWQYSPNGRRYISARAQS